MRIFSLIIVFLLVSPSLGLSAARTSNAVTGSMSSGSSWVGGVAPTTGDTITIVAGADITVDTDIILGNKVSSVGNAVTINGTSSSSYGVLRVADGVSLTLRGTGRSTNTMMLINQYGKFIPAPGSSILGDCASDFQSGIRNNGIIEAIGTDEKRITFSIPSTSWTGLTTDVTGEVKSGTGDTYYGYVRIRKITNLWISNSGKTGIGSASDTSFVITASTPSGLATTPVGSIAEVDSAGEYYLDHDAGYIYFYSATAGTSITYNYSYLNRAAAGWVGWGIWSISDISYNSADFRYCIFERMGSVAQYETAGPSIDIVNTDAALLFGFKKSTTFEAYRTASVRDSEFRYCHGGLLTVHEGNGTATDKLLFTNNTFNASPSGARNLAPVTITGLGSSYLDFSNNTLNTYGGVYYIPNGGVSNLEIKNNSGNIGTSFYDGGIYPPITPRSPDITYSETSSIYMKDVLISGNTIAGRGGSADGRMLDGVSGSSGHPTIIEYNDFSKGNRIGQQRGSYVIYRKNIFSDFYHHGMTASTVDDLYFTDITWENNLFKGTSNTSMYGDAWIQTGYNHRTVLNNFKVINNTVQSGNSLLAIGDPSDGGATQSLVTNLVFKNNLIYGSKYTVTRDLASYTKAHVLEFDNNLYYGMTTGFNSGWTNNTNWSTFWSGSNKYNTYTGRNIKFVGLYDPSYTTAQTGRTLSHTVNTAGQDQTLSWGGGTPVQLISDYGTSAGQSKRTVTCLGKSWTLDGVRGKWLWVYGGTGSGQASAIVNYGSGLYSAALVSGGSSYSANQYIQLNGGTSTYGAVIKILTVSSGVITSFEIISGGIYSVTPSDAVVTTRITGSSGSGATFNCLWGPTLLLAPDLTTSVDNTSTFAIVHSEVTLTDTSSGTTRAGIYGPELSTTSADDTGITVTVDRTFNQNPLFVGSSFPSSNIIDYTVQSGSPAIGAADHTDMPTDDYFDTTRVSGDLGFFEFSTSGGKLIIGW